MAQAFSVRPYGEITGNPPYNGNSLTDSYAYPSAAIQLTSFAVEETSVWPINPAVNMNGVYCYSAIVQPAAGLQQFNKVYAAKETVSTLATLRG